MQIHRLLLATTVAAGFALMAGGNAAAQSAVLSGQVSSSEEGAMEGVVVSAKKVGSTITVSVISDAQGHFSFPSGRLDPGGLRELPVEKKEYPGTGEGDHAGGEPEKADDKGKP